MLVGLTSLLLGGCGATDQQALIVTIEPLAGASTSPEPSAQGIPVSVTTLNPQHALRVSDYTRWIGGGPAADGPAVLTDASGKARVLAPLDRPFLVQVLLPGLQPETVYLRENGADENDFVTTDWITLPVGIEADARGVPVRRWRVRVSDADAFTEGERRSHAE